MRRLTLFILPLTFACSEGGVELGAGLSLPASLDFGLVAVGARAERTLELENSSEEPVRLEALRIEGGEANTHRFTVTHDALPLLVPAGGAARVTVVFEPFLPIGAQVNARLDLVTARGEGRTNLGGRAQAALRFEPETLEFGEVTRGQTRELQLWVHNTLPTPTPVLAVDHVGRMVRVVAEQGSGLFEIVGSIDDAGAFSEGPLPPQGSLLLKVRYTPAAADNAGDRASLRLAGCGESELCTQRLPLLGSGAPATAVTCTPPSLSFGAVEPGRTGTLTLTCVSERDQTLTGAQVLPARAPFAVIGDLPGRLARGARFSLDVQFAPPVGAIGTAEATLSLELTAEAAPTARADLALVGVAARCPALRPGALDFGRVAVGTRLALEAYIQNPDAADLQVLSIDADPQGTGAFRSDTTGLVVPAGMERAVRVELEPLVPGPVRSELRVVSAACGTLAIPLSGEGLSLPPCSASAEALRFGQVLLNQSRDRAVRIVNDGSSACLIRQPALEVVRGSGVSRAGLWPDDVLLAAGESLALPLRYAPRAAESLVATLRFLTSNPATPERSASILGEGSTSPLVVSPDVLELVAPPGCAAVTARLWVHNTGATAHVLESAALSPGTGGLSLEPPLPAGGQSLAPGEVLELVVRHVPGGPGRSDALLTLTERGSLTPHLVPLRVEVTGGREERFWSAPRSVDALWMVDDSAGVSAAQVELAQNAGAYLQSAQTADYQVAVISADLVDCGPAARAGAYGHCGYFATSNAQVNRPDWRLITRATQPSPAEALAGLAALGQTGSGLEPGLSAVALALSPPRITGWNAGFLRADAGLSLLFWADEDDASGLSTELFLAELDALKGVDRRNELTVAVIAGDPAVGCAGPVGSASPSPIYHGLAHLAAGAFESLCYPGYADMLGRLGEVGFGPRAAWRLSASPDAASITVQVNGASVPSTRWVYDPVGRALVFDPLSLPPFDSEIVVRYLPSCGG